MFSDFGGAAASECDMAFLGLYAGTLSAGDVADLETWATDHYGMAIA